MLMSIRPCSSWRAFGRLATRQSDCNQDESDEQCNHKSAHTYSGSKALILFALATLFVFLATSARTRVVSVGLSGHRLTFGGLVFFAFQLYKAAWTGIPFWHTRLFKSKKVTLYYKRTIKSSKNGTTRVTLVLYSG